MKAVAVIFCGIMLISTVVFASDNSQARSKRGVPSLPDYFQRRVKPRIDGGVEIVREHVVPAIVGTAISLGNAGVTAVAQFRRAASPVVRESAAHLQHTVNEHIAPGVAASVKTLGDTARDGVDRVAAAVLGEETHSRVHETMGAVGTIARYLTGINSSSEFDDYTDYKDYSEIHGPHYSKPVYDYSTDQLVYQSSGDVYYDYPYTQSSEFIHTLPPAQYISSNHLYEGRNIPSLDVGLGPHDLGEEEEGVGRDGVPQDRDQTVEEALYIIGKNVLGPNMTNRLLPVVAQISEGFGLVGEGLNTIGGAISSRAEGDQARGKRGEVGRPRVVTPAPPCTTPSGGRGFCRDIQACPVLLADLKTLRGSICFKSLFAPGVCCPLVGLGDLIGDSGSVNSNNGNPEAFPTQPTLPSISDLPTPSLSPAALPPQGFKHSFVPGTSNRCGGVKVPQGRIVGGNETYEGEVPWMSAIFLHGAGRKEFWCGGALVTDRHVITAAHCTKDKNKKSFSASQFTVRVGEWDLSDEDQYTLELEVESYEAHPNFRPNGFYSDIAVFKLKRSVPFNEYIQPVCLPVGQLANQLFVNELPLALGWGTTYYDGQEVPRLRGVPLPVWTNEDCDKTYFQPITEVFLCAGYADGGRDACQGDSGGPLMLYNEQTNSWVLIGIVSFGNRCAEPGYPGVYTRVTHFIDWVLDKVNN